MINQVLVKAFANLIVSIDLSDEETVDSDFAASAFEDVMSALGELSDEERMEFVRVVRSLAESESSPSRRQAMMEFPESFGLVDDEE